MKLRGTNAHSPYDQRRPEKHILNKTLDGLVDASANVLVISTVGATVNFGVAILVQRGLFLLRRSGESVSGFLWIARLLVLTGTVRIIRLALFWRSMSIILPVWLTVSSNCLGLITIVAIPLVLSEQQFVALSEKGAAAFGRWISWAMRITALVSIVAFLGAHRLNRPQLFWLIPLLSCLVAAVLLLLKAAAVRKLQTRNRGLLLCSIFTSAALAAISSSILYEHVEGVAAGRGPAFALYLELSGMLLTFGMIFTLANLRSADMTVKHGIRVYFCCLMSLGVWETVEAWSNHSHAFGNRTGKAGFGLLAVVLIIFVFSFTQAALLRLNIWVEDSLFQMPHFEEAVEKFWKELVTLTTPEEVKQAGESILCETMLLATARIISLEQLESAGIDVPLPGPNPYLPPRHSSLRIAFDPPADCLSTLFQEGVGNACLVLTCGASRPHLTPLDLSFVSRIVGQIQLRVDTLISDKRRLERLGREDALRSEIAEAELRALRAQINPHFLFNSLNSIADLSIEDPSRAEEMTLRLAAVFRYVLANADRSFISVQEELEFARSYLAIEETRFGERLKVKFAIDPGLLNQNIPTLLLQPLIENALKHGLGPKREGGTLTISAARVALGFQIIVSDDGIGLGGRATLSSTVHLNVGIGNVRRRLHTAYDENASLTLTPRIGGGTDATVTIKKLDQELL